MRGFMIFAIGAFLGVAGLILFQRYEAPTTYDECLLAEAKGWSEAEMAVVNRVCYRRFQPGKISIAP